MKIWCWNCRGMKSVVTPTLPFISSVVKSLLVDVIFLSETKCPSIDLEASFSRLGLVNWAGVDSVNAAGGLFLCWSNNVSFKVVFSSTNIVFCKVEETPGSSMYVSFVYGSPYLELRSSVWDLYGGLIQSHLGKHLLIGDFNQLEFSTQKLGGSRYIKGANKFTHWRMENNLLEIPAKGVQFTWTNNRDNGKVVLEQLDRGYCNDEWRQTHPNAVIWNFPIFLSDHGPVLLDTSPQPGKTRHPYKLEAWALSLQPVTEIIDEEWNKHTSGSRLFVLQRKLQNIKVRLKHWCLNYKKRHRCSMG